MPATAPEETEHTSAYGSRTIPIVVWDATLPAEIFPCSAGVFFSKMLSLKMMVLHFLMFLLGTVKDEEEDAGITVYLCVSVWSELGPFSGSLVKSFPG